MIVQIVIPTLPPSHHACQQIRRNKKDTPAFNLAHVGLLVIAAFIEAARVSADDHVSQRHCRKAAQPAQPARESAVELNRSAANLPASARAESQHTGEHPDERGGRGPEITKKREHNRSSYPRRQPEQACTTRDSRATLDDCPLALSPPLGYLKAILLKLERGRILPLLAATLSRRRTCA
jgi:hypothetical protein